jgi:hypothetical protein
MLLHQAVTWFRQGLIRGARRITANAVMFSRPKPAGLSTAEVPLEEPRRLDAIAQWGRIRETVLGTCSKAVNARQRQQDAAAQLDAATYALQRLREEIAPVMLTWRAAQAATADYQPAQVPMTGFAFRRAELSAA